MNLIHKNIKKVKMEKESKNVENKYYGSHCEVKAKTKYYFLHDLGKFYLSPNTCDDIDLLLNFKSKCPLATVELSIQVFLINLPNKTVKMTFRHSENKKYIGCVKAESFNGFGGGNYGVYLNKKYQTDQSQSSNSSGNKRQRTE